MTVLAKDFVRLCDRWKKAQESGRLPRPDLLLNDTMPAKALVLLRRLHDETLVKLDAAVAGVYRYRDSERRVNRKKPTSR
ncbi:MAG: hypothetical protein JW809_10855 [Pirellulales bacterium]|nr:hypothetical protein [Pirellulales bacterium]